MVTLNHPLLGDRPHRRNMVRYHRVSLHVFIPLLSTTSVDDPCTWDDCPKHDQILLWGQYPNTTPAVHPAAQLVVHYRYAKTRRETPRTNVLSLSHKHTQKHTNTHTQKERTIRASWLARISDGEA